MSNDLLFSKFEIIDCYKKDDSMAVYLANHIYLHKKIILKTLNTKLIANPAILKRFKREAQLLAKIDHPNIITVYDFGQAGDYFYISFEYFESQNLREAFNDNGWSVQDKMSIVQQICIGLVETHSHKIIHRDLKPENILINKNKLVKIADFGLAQISGSEKLTAPESVVGTPAYMAPEQIQGITTDERTDLFAFGIIIFELFYGQNPFLGDDAGQTLNNIQKCSWKPISSKTDIPSSILKLIEGLLKKNKNERIQTSREVLSYFDLPTNEPELKKPARKTGKITLIFVLLVIAFVFFFKDNLFTAKPIVEKVNQSERDSLKTDSVQIYLQDTLTRPIILAPKNEKENKPGDLVAMDTEKEIGIKEVLKETPVPTFGYLDLKCSPWADIFIDSQKVDTTPIKNAIRLESGQYFLQLRHPDYPVYSETIKISEENVLELNVNLNNFAGFLKCNVFPWGNIYIDNVFKGQTPLKNVIILEPGKHTLEVRNSKYKTYTSEIFAEKEDTLFISVDLIKENK
ncbi:MAG: serine/threonine protein kinase [Calditrichaeota bacterium]|nr:MAG: serine/threonine protein kinase [Calditrichota bacterium]MBL1206069.1 serine/threonine protein kinase [Calditrichota bacterium]NOG45895.1 serine/threonine protein kinase [Calditrichota bacterium]